jgi:hypothetical protein
MATRKRPENEGTPSSAEFFGSLAEIGLRGTAQVIDMQYSALRALWETRARTAAAFGYPDYAGAFAGHDDDRVRQVLQTTTEQLVDASQQMSEATAQIQSHVRRIFESQAQATAENWQQTIEQFGARAAESSQQLCAGALEQAERFGRLARVRVEETQAALQQAGEQLSQVAGESARRGAEALARVSDASRGQMNGGARHSAHAAHEANGRRAARPSA